VAASRAFSWGTYHKRRFSLAENYKCRGISMQKMQADNLQVWRSQRFSEGEPTINHISKIYISCFSKSSVSNVYVRTYLGYFAEDEEITFTGTAMIGIED
jgi:hypothetical protein